MKRFYITQMLFVVTILSSFSGLAQSFSLSPLNGSFESEVCGTHALSMQINNHNGRSFIWEQRTKTGSADWTSWTYAGKQSDINSVNFYHESFMVENVNENFTIQFRVKLKDSAPAEYSTNTLEKFLYGKRGGTLTHTILIPCKTGVDTVILSLTNYLGVVQRWERTVTTWNGTSFVTTPWQVIANTNSPTIKHGMPLIGPTDSWYSTYYNFRAITTNNFCTGISNETGSLSASTQEPTTMIRYTLTASKPMSCDSWQCNLSICQGESVVLTANPVGGNSPTSYYKWSTGETTQSITVTSAGSYTFLATKTQPGCERYQSDKTVTVSISQNPKPTITPSRPSSCTTSGSITLTSSDAQSYQWSTGSYNKSISVSTESNYYVDAFYSNGCSNRSDHITFSIKPTVSVSPSNSTICSGSTVELTASGAQSYSWTPITGISPANAAVVTASPTLTTTYTVTGTAGNGCTDSKTALVNVSRPTASITSANVTLCSGGSTIISGDISATGGWSLTLSNGGGTVTGNGSGTWSRSVSPSSTTQYVITSLSDVVCSALPSDLTGSETVTVNPRPTAAITSSGASYCSGGVSTSVSGTITASGLWTLTLSNGGGTVTGNGSGSWSHGVSPNSSTTYTIASLTDANCSSVPSGLTGSTTFTIYTPNDPYITSLYDVCTYGYTILVASGAYGATSYQWSNGGVDQSIYANPYATYTVVAKFGDCSSNPVSFYVEPCIAGYCYDAWGNQIECVQPYLMAEGVLGIYPNPASDVILVQVPIAAETNLEVTIHSQLGTEVGRTAILKGKTEATFDARNLADGIYIITLKAPKKVIIRQKVIVKHER